MLSPHLKNAAQAPSSPSTRPLMQSVVERLESLGKPNPPGNRRHHCPGLLAVRRWACRRPSGWCSQVPAGSAAAAPRNCATQHALPGTEAPSFCMPGWLRLQLLQPHPPLSCLGQCLSCCCSEAAGRSSPGC
eukprot:1154773-Pelagomonas_calceolata.AAC.2